MLAQVIPVWVLRADIFQTELQSCSRVPYRALGRFVNTESCREVDNDSAPGLHDSGSQLVRPRSSTHFVNRGETDRSSISRASTFPLTIDSETRTRISSSLPRPRFARGIVAGATHWGRTYRAPSVTAVGVDDFSAYVGSVAPDYELEERIRRCDQMIQPLTFVDRRCQD